ncbi:glycosyltransferase family 2 protein [Niveibacterium sp. SC-1]|uniref:glycosyltransferase family 2 protein n=1 Tax=Niveibacterium sp. SC-1 TaxID=3135646 RepID=UPI00311DDB00
MTEPKTSQPHVTVVLLNWNGWRDTLACLESLLRSEYGNASVVVVDNASTDGSRAHIESWAATERTPGFARAAFIAAGEALPFGALAAGDLLYVQSPVNGGFAAGNNHGIRAALAGGADYVWILNNDTEIDCRALSALVQKVEDDPRIGMCGSLLVYYDAREQVQACGGVSFSYWRALGQQIGYGLNPANIDSGRILQQPLTYVAGASLLARSAMIREVGAFEERYFLYYEEIDWAERAAHWKLAVALDSVVYHKEGGSIGTASRQKRSPLSQYYLNRNLILFYGRFHKMRLPVAIMRVCKELAQRIKYGDYHLARVTWRALVDGVRVSDGPIDRTLLERA